MADRLVTIATFYSAVEAALAKNRLEADGIPAWLGGEETMSVFGDLVGSALGGVKLLVSEEHVLRAEDVLSALDQEDEDNLDERDQEDEDELDEPDQEEEQPEEDLANKEENITAAPTAPDQGEAQRSSAITSEPAETRREEDNDRAPVAEAGGSSAAAGPLAPVDLRLPPGEELSRRALKASLIGLILLPPLLHIYSIVLLLRLSSVKEELSQAAVRRVYVALAFDLLGIVLSPFFWLFLSNLTR